LIPTHCCDRNKTDGKYTCDKRHPIFIKLNEGDDGFSIRLLNWPGVLMKRGNDLLRGQKIKIETAKPCRQELGII